MMMMMMEMVEAGWLCGDCQERQEHHRHHETPRWQGPGLLPRPPQPLLHLQLHIQHLTHPPNALSGILPMFFRQFENILRFSIFW